MASALPLHPPLTQGSYVSRALSFKGAAFEMEHVALTPQDHALYERAASWWSKLLDVGCFSGRPGASTYWSAHLRFFKSLCLAFKVGMIVKSTATFNVTSNVTSNVISTVAPIVALAPSRSRWTGPSSLCGSI